MSLIPEADGVRIRWTWRTSAALPLGILVVCFDYYTFQFYQTGFMTWAVHPVLYIYGAFSLVAHYYLLALLLNKTDVVVTRAGIRVLTGPVPLPWNRSQEVPAEHIRQVRGQARDDGEDATFTWYEVIYRGPQGQRGRLVNWIDELEQAQFFAHHLRRALRLRSGNEDENDG